MCISADRYLTVAILFGRFGKMILQELRNIIDRMMHVKSVYKFCWVFDSFAKASPKILKIDKDGYDALMFFCKLFN